ncbi:hypothetical protein [Bacteroides cellulosilyticus]|jgi:hypothetical protein|uniref:Uncharacterized protein n=2 Tax=Bacteroides cellulosilyticus TaxID=246787 RepID=A0A6L3JU73_9BACE|nr:hypothetical protein [Bacteroides cellulosilyticus]KAA5413758.1 hypothetical protein F2Y87_25225 [Bacteroides cellulosilyticus]
MKHEKIRNPLCLKNTLVIIFISFTTINCESNKDILVNNDWFNVATIVSMVDIPVPELSEEEATLIDSISGMKEFIEYHEYCDKLRRKMIPYISKLTQEELNELAQKGTDSTYISDFTFKMKSQLDIEKEFEAAGKARKNFEKRIEAIKFTPSERIALIIMLCK